MHFLNHKPAAAAAAAAIFLLAAVSFSAPSLPLFGAPPVLPVGPVDAWVIPCPIVLPCIGA